MTERVRFPAGGSGVLATPESEERRPGIVVIHEYWGVNEQIQSTAQAWAGEGFVALVPDLYHGEVATSADEAQAMMNKLDWPAAMQEIATAVAYLRAHPRCSGKIVITGYCMGGALTFAAACKVGGLAAAIPFYGLPPGGDWYKVEAPIQAHFAKHDDWATIEGGKNIEATLEALGKSMELHVYDAKHAFCNDRRPEVYDAAAARQSWARAVTFARQYTS